MFQVVEPRMMVGHQWLVKYWFLSNIIVDLCIKTIEKVINAKNSLEIEKIFGPSRVHFPFPFSFGEGEGEGEASVKMSDFLRFFDFLEIFCKRFRNDFGVFPNIILGWKWLFYQKNGYFGVPVV